MAAHPSARGLPRPAMSISRLRGGVGLTFLRLPGVRQAYRGLLLVRLRATAKEFERLGLRLADTSIRPYLYLDCEVREMCGEYIDLAKKRKGWQGRLGDLSS